MLPARLLAVVLLVAGLTGCSAAAEGPGTSTALPGITVSGTPGQPPVVGLRTPLSIGHSRVRTVVVGDGPRVSLDRVFVIGLVIVDGRTGRTAVSTYDAGRTPMAVTDSEDTLFPVLAQALAGQRQGSRVVVAATAHDAFGDAGAPQYDIRPGDPVVMVADVIAVPPRHVLDGPQGTPQPQRPGVPRVVETDGRPGHIVFGSRGRLLPKPKRLVVVPLVHGSGQVVGPHDLVTLDVLGQTWGSSQQFTDTFGGTPVTVALGADRVIPAWDRALVGQHLGSRLLVLTPPDLAFAATGNPPAIPGNATLAYVIDVLGVS